MADNSTEVEVKAVRTVHEGKPIIRHDKVTKQSFEDKKKARILAGEAAVKAHFEFVNDEDNWEYVDIPEVDLFDKPFGNITINADTYGPGRHFLDPDLAGEIRRIVKTREQADLRIYRPTQDKKMLETMRQMGKPVTVAGTSAEGIDAYMRKETGM